MKLTKSITILASGLLLSCASLSAQATVSTDPVGYVTVTIEGTGGIGDETFNFISVPLISSPAISSSVSSFGSFSINDSLASWDDNEWNELYFVEVTSGTALGFTSQIVGNSSNQLTTAEDLSSVITEGDTYSIRKYPTIGSVFGRTKADVEALGIQTGVSVAEADEVLILNEEGKYDIYFFNSNDVAILSGWRSTTAPTLDASETVIVPGSGFVYKRKAVANFNLVVANSVQVLTSLSNVIEPGFNFIASNYPVPLTLASYFGDNGVEAGLVGGLSVAEADNILVPNDSGGYNTYFYNTNSVSILNGWRSTTAPTIDAKDVVIAEAGKSFIVRRIGEATNIIETRPF